MTTTEIILSIGAAAFVVFVTFFVTYVANLRRTSTALREFIRKSEENMSPALIELRGALENIRKITDNVSAVTEDVKYVADTLVDLEKGVKTLYEYYKEGMGAAVSANISGLKAGVKTGVVTLVKNLKEKGK